MAMAVTLASWGSCGWTRTLAVGSVMLLAAGSAIAFAPPAASTRGPVVPGAGAGASIKRPDAAEPVVRFDGHKVAAVKVATTRDMLALQALSDDIWSCGPIKAEAGQAAWVPARFSPEQFAALNASGMKFRVVIDDVQGPIDAERARLAQAHAAGGGGGGAGGAGGGAADGPGWFSDYKNYTEISQYVDDLVALRPDLVTRITLGNSLEGREIFGMKITSSVGGPDKPGIFFHSLLHAREWVTGPSTMYVADQFIRNYDSDADLREILDTFEVYIVPIANPDGYEYTWSNNRMWRKNRRPNSGGSFGVDNNRNFGTGWGGEGASTQQNNETYRGTGPFSEPETQVIRDFALSKPNLVFGMDVHCFSQLVLSAWGFTSELPPDRAMFAEIDAGLLQAFEAPFGNDFVGGPTYTTIYPASGVASDWLYDGAGLIGYGVELRDTGQFGFVLPPDQIVPSGIELLSSVKYIAGWLIDNTVRINLVTPVTTLTPSVDVPLTVNIVRGTSSPVPGTETMWYRVGRTGPFTPVVLSPVDANSYAVTLPSAGCNALVQYYFSTDTAAGVTVVDPAGGPLEPYAAIVAAPTTVLSDGGETNTGWTLGAPGDTATSGQWTRANPNGTIAQPEDAYAGTNCFFTGQGSPGGADGSADVDGGFTTLITPALDLSSALGAEISYARWYDNASGATPNQDVLRISISNNDGASWIPVETVGPGGPETVGGWFIHSFAVADFVPPTAQVRLRFVAEDADPGSLVEAAIDELHVTVNTCGPACVGDWDRNGTVNSTDVSAFINTWFEDQANGTLNADFNDDGVSNSTDVSDFINTWFEPC